MKRSLSLIFSLALGVMLGMAATVSLFAQQVGGAGHVLLRAGLTGEPDKEVYMTLFEPKSGGQIGPHSHPGDELSYIIDGTIEFNVTGESPRVLHPGDTFYVERDKVHGGKVISSTPAKIISVHIIDKGQSLIHPANAAR